MTPILVGLVLAANLGSSADGQSRLEPERPDQKSFLTRAVFADGRLWTLTDAGEVSWIVEGAESWTREILPEPALELCLQHGHPLAVTCERESCSTWTLRRWESGTWSTGQVVQADGDDLVTVNCTAEDVTLLTTRRIVDLGPKGVTVVLLSEPLESRLVASTCVRAEQLFVGLNAGEWGGGLRRIDRRTGKVSVIESNVTGGLCGGPLNTECDPVHGIVPEPWNPDCLAVAIGLVHFSPHGRIVEVCGDKVKRFCYEPFGEREGNLVDEKSDEPFETVAFFGLTSSGDSLWAVGVDGIYRIVANGTAQRIPLPEFRTIGGVSVSFDLPRFVLVLTDVNQRCSISGSVPMLVTR